MTESGSSHPEIESFLSQFGLETFRPGQREVISTVLSGRDCLCVMPTGGGKSLCYQLPAIAAGGLTLVISPLIALMKDQVDGLRRLGLPVTFINSTLSTQELFDRLDQMAQGRYCLVYVVPERFRSRRFLEAARRADVKLFAVDEAHCISEWGHDFRPDYARLGKFRQMIGDPPTIALTATATEKVRQDIAAKLALRDPLVFVRGFERPNLFYRVERPASEREKNRRLLSFLNKTPGSGIVYASSRRRTEDIADFISSQTRRKVAVYHAGLLAEQRKMAQEAFMRGEIEIVVATNAFGMGIDKADVRFVVHYNMPGTLEGYYQEAGRAGRDGEPSECLMLFHASDRKILEYFIESSYPSPDVVADVLNLLRAIEGDPIEMTQQEIKQRLGLSVGPDGVGACEELLEEAGVIERLVASENRASVRLTTDLATLVDLLPPRATKRRRVLQAVERLVGARRGEQVFFRPGELAAGAHLELPAVKAALRELNRLEDFTYVPPFRGRAIRVLDRKTPFHELKIDFERQRRRREAEYEKIHRVIRFVHSVRCRQRDILEYFGEDDAADCAHCDNCRRRGVGDPDGDGRACDDDAFETETQGPPVDPSRVATRVRMALAGVARARRQCPCGKRLIAQMLCGSEAANIKRLRFDKLSTFGLLGDLKQTEVADLLDALLSAGFLKQQELQANRPILELTPSGVRFMRDASGEEVPPLPGELAETLGSGYTSTRSEPQPPAEATETKPDPAEAEAGDEPQQPRHYWTWRLLNAGFTARECQAVRRMSLNEIFDDLARADEEGWAFDLDRVLRPETIAQLDALTATGGPLRAQDLLAQLPAGARYEEVALYLRRKPTPGDRAAGET